MGQSKVGQVAGAVKQAVTQRVPKVARKVYRREVLMGAFFITCGAYGARGRHSNDLIHSHHCCLSLNKSSFFFIIINHRQ